MQDLKFENLDTLLEIWKNIPQDNRANLQTYILEYLNVCPETLTSKIRKEQFWSYLYYAYDDGMPECDNIVTEIIHQQFKFIVRAIRKSLDWWWEGAVEDGDVETDDWGRATDEVWNDFKENYLDRAIANIIESTPDDHYYFEYFGENDIMTAVIECINEFYELGYEDPGEVLIAGLNSILDNIHQMNLNQKGEN